MQSAVQQQGAADVPAGRAFDVWRLRALDAAEFGRLGGAERLSREQLAYLAAWAHLAPTTHNTVPQRFELREEEGALVLWVDRTAVLPESDPVGRQAMVSLGCVVESACVAAAAYGLQADVSLVPDAEAAIRPAVEGQPRLVEAVRVHLRRGGPVLPPVWLNALRQRKVVRAEYDERVRLEAALAEELGARASALHEGLTLHLLSDAPTQLFLGKFQELADSTVINRERFARELGDWLVPNDSEALLGMRGREFGLSDEATLRLHRGLRGEGPLLPDETGGFAKSGNLGMRTASAVAVLAAARDDFAHRLAAGRAYQQLALRLLQDGYCTAMHAGITEVEAPNLALRGRLRTRQRPTVVFRVGKPLHEADGARPHSSRPPLEEVLLKHHR